MKTQNPTPDLSNKDETEISAAASLQAYWKKILPVLSVPDFVELDMFELSVGCHCCLKHEGILSHESAVTETARYERKETCVRDEVRQLTGARGPVPLLKSMLAPSARSVETRGACASRHFRTLFLFSFFFPPVTYGGWTRWSVTTDDFRNRFWLR